ncbi:MAG: LamG-like jellyroll fold domain-containing protein [Pirellulaceae bacterium]
MKRLSRVAGVLAFTSVASFALLAGGQTPISHWRLDEGFTDVTATTVVDHVNSNDGVWANPAGSPTYAQGILGGAVQFNPSVDLGYFSIADIPQIEGVPGGISISLWFKPTSSAGYRGLLTSRGTDSDLGVLVPPNPTQPFGVNYEGDHIDSRVSGSALDTPANSVVLNEWQHVAWVWDNAVGSQTTYLNGAEAGTKSDAAGVFFFDGGVWHLGDDDCCGNRVTPGLLDDVAMYNISLTASEIETIYQNGLNGIDAMGVTAAALKAGDVDGNGAVNAADFEIIRANFYESATARSQGDLSLDGFVGFEDFREWKANVGQATATTASVPEPGTLSLIVLGCLGWAFRRKGKGC